MVIRQGSSPLVGVPAAKSTPGRAELTVVGPAAEPEEQVLGRSNWERRYTSNLRITDTVVVCGAVLLAQYVRFGSTPAADNLANHYESAYSALLVVIWLATLAGLRTRSPKYIGAGIEEYRRVVAASFWTFGAVAIAELLMKLEVSRGYLAVALPAGILGLVLSRWQWRGHVLRQREDRQLSDRGVGYRRQRRGRESRRRTDRQRRYGYHVVGIGVPGYSAPRGEHLTINGRQIPIIGGEGHVSGHP